MAEVTNELIYEVLKAVQARLGNLEEAARDTHMQFAAVRGDLRAIHAEIGAMKIDIGNLYEGQNAINRRLGHIERRLDIHPEPAQ